jgi:hypothetical protein
MELAIKRGDNGYRISDSHQRAEYTDHEVELMRQLRAAKMKVKDIARRFDASPGYVSRVCSFKLRR